MTKITSPSFPIGLPPFRTESQARLGILPKTEYRREHFEFQREQSRVMKDCEWSDRCAGDADSDETPGDGNEA